MRLFCKKTVALSAGLLCAAGSAFAENGPYGSPSLLPLPQAGPQLQSYPTGGYQPVKYQPEPVPMAPNGNSPSDFQGQPPQADGQMAGDNGSADWGCDCNLPSCGCCCSPWFGSIGSLIMTRDKANCFWTSYETGNNPNQVMCTEDAHADWRGGGEVTIGRWFNCGGTNCCGARRGIQFSYFTLDPFQGFASVRGDQFPGGTVSTPIDVTNGNPLIGGQPAAGFFDNATEHRLWRQDELHNLELNLLSQRVVNTCCAQVTWLAGVRWFRFDESIIFGSVAGGSEFGDNVGANVNGAAEAYLSNRVVNDLVGFQIGTRADWSICDRLGVFVAPKIGIYGNDISSHTRLYGGDGAQGFDITGSDNQFSMLGQIDAGINYQFCGGWRAFTSYRAIAVSNIALSDNQFLPYLADTAGFAEVKGNGSLILHGVYSGIEYRF